MGLNLWIVIFSKEVTMKESNSCEVKFDDVHDFDDSSMYVRMDIFPKRITLADSESLLTRDAENETNGNI